jgi:RNase P subunit RPR2
MTESNRLLVACPQCHAWPMATSGPKFKWTNPSQMMFRCPRCGHQASFNITREVDR